MRERMYVVSYVTFIASIVGMTSVSSVSLMSVGLVTGLRGDAVLAAVAEDKQRDWIEMSRTRSPAAPVLVR